MDEVVCEVYHLSSTSEWGYGRLMVLGRLADDVVCWSIN